MSSQSEFHASPEGRLIASLVEDEAMIREMISLSKRDRPAVEALDTRLAGKVELDNPQRQHVGRWVRDIMHDRGWRTKIQRRIPNGQIFASGTVYAAAKPAPADEGPPPHLLPAKDRIAHAQALVRAFSTNDYGVDDFLRDKRAEAARENAAD